MHCHNCLASPLYSIFSSISNKSPESPAINRIVNETRLMIHDAIYELDWKKQSVFDVGVSTKFKFRLGSFSPNSILALITIYYFAFDRISNNTNPPSAIDDLVKHCATLLSVRK